MFDLQKIISHMGPFAMLVAGTLVLMALAAVAVFIERLWVMARSRRASSQFAATARTVLESATPESLIDAANKTQQSHLARLLGAGMSTFLKQQKRNDKKLGAVEATQRELLRQTESLGADVRRGMGVLASVGSVAPFVGLLGTVVGIIDAFGSIAKEGTGGLGAVSAGISEALVVTALGLLVAIPSVLAHNFLTTKSDKLMLQLEQARGEFIDWLETRFGRSVDGNAA